MARRKPSGLIARTLQGLLVLLLVLGVVGPVLTTLIYRFVPPPVTWLMIQRITEGRGLERRWVPLRDMSPNLVYAVIAAEDARFCQHRGFDLEAIESAMESNARGRRLRGGSTISQQTAKNVFLWPQRSWIRKGLEAYFTVLIELIWGKPRILEIYLNAIEWGPGVYGAESAAQKTFQVSARALTPAQAARLAAVIPSPLKWSAARPGPYVQRRSARISRAAADVRRAGLASCAKT